MDKDTVRDQVRQFRFSLAQFNQRLRDSGFFFAIKRALEGRESQ